MDVMEMFSSSWSDARIRERLVEAIPYSWLFDPMGRGATSREIEASASDRVTADRAQGVEVNEQ